MKYFTTRQLVELSLHTALTLINARFLRAPLRAQFAHFGNALVIAAVLLYGPRLDMLVAAIGLGLFDVLNGYAIKVWITILESLIVCLVLHFVFEKLMRPGDKMRNVIVVGVVVVITKVISNLAKYTIINSIVGSLQFQVAFLAALAKIDGTFGLALVAITSVSILYPILRRIFLHHTQPKTVSE